MRKLIDSFKNLPPELRMLLAMLGLGSLPAAYYLLAKTLGISPQTVLIGMVVVVGAICLVAFLIPKLFNRGARRRSRQMEADLASAAESGPASMDLRAAIKANNEKYFTAIRAMRKNVGISVYDLPWYIVIGDSGCGKTKLVNEGGLTFSTGRPEGYQLGTLNYNWWFTEDAVFVDMAGRLCNPQDDADRREWLAFLDTIARGRKGFPVNGAVCCISAEHLLEDPPEKQEQDANTMLERLRDLQTRLGVTFATYLVVTKCDKILGFMQLFDRAERDLTMKNQMFGWSKPGTFAELYNPDDFANDFDSIYQRLNDLRTRRMSDDVDETELGLAYSFPEEFRTLRDPLKIYVQMLFPYVKNPKAIKNLIFRGVYFTSATQHGSVILKHLRERLGTEAAERFEPLESLYPTPRPHFVKDVLFRKIFPEHGLVFRNEQQVIRSRRLAGLLKFGSVALAVVLFGLLGVGFYAFAKAVNEPRQHALRSATVHADPGKSLELADQLHKDADGLQGSLAARILFPFTGALPVVQDLKTIQLRLFEEGSLKRLLVEADAALRTRGPNDFRNGAQPIEGNAYLDALTQYLAWLAGAEPKVLGEHFETLCAVAAKADNAVVSTSSAFQPQARLYFQRMQEDGPWDHNPARLVRDLPIDPAATFDAAVKKVHAYLEPYARLEKDLDGTVSEWMRVRASCGLVEDSYRGILDAAQKDPDTLEAFNALKAGFVSQYQPAGERPGGFVGGMKGCAWTITAVPPARVRIEMLGSAIQRQRGIWTGYADRLKNAYRGGQGSPADESRRILAGITALTEGSSGALAGLDPLLWATLKSASLTTIEYPKGHMDTAFDKSNQLFKEVIERYAQIIQLKPGGDVGNDSLEITADAKRVGEVLGQIGERLAKATTDPPKNLADETPAKWLADFERLNPESAAAAASSAELKLAKEWQPDRLAAFEAKHRDWIARAEGTRLLNTIAQRLDETRIGPWGSAELEPEWCKAIKGAPYSIRAAACETPTTGRRGTSQPGTPKETAPTRSRRARRERAGAETRAPARTERQQDTVGGGEEEMHNVATREFWNEHYQNYANLLDELDNFPPEHYLSSGDQNPVKLCQDRARAAFQAYLRQYVTAWGSAYDQKLKALDKLLAPAESSRDWKALCAAVNRDAAAPLPGDVARLLGPSLDWVLRCTRWLAYDPRPEAGWWKDPDLQNWLTAAFNDQQIWPHGPFVVCAWQRMPELKPTPWQFVSDECKTRWYRVCESVARNAELKRWVTELPPRPAERIPWGDMRSLMKQNELQDEKLTARIAAFEAQGQLLLSRALTQELVEIQTAAFQSQVPLGGWPYLDDKADPLKTVELADFKKFLLEVRKAETVYRPLEEGLPDEIAGKKARKELYAACARWADFMLDEKTQQPRELTLTLTSRDPQLLAAGDEKQRDTAQHFYRTVHLRLGLGKAVDAVDQDPEKIPTTADGKARLNQMYKRTDGAVPAAWKWRSAREITDQDLFITLEDPERVGLAANAPIAPGCRILLGKPRELALCAYLAHDAQQGMEGKAFEKEHWFDPEKDVIPGSTVPAELKKYRFGIRVVFVLDRPMPGAIARLEPVAAPR